MFNMDNMSAVSSKLMDRFFKKVPNVVWDLSTGRIGVKNKDGIVTMEGTGEDAQVSLNMFDQFGIEVPAFAQSTPVDAVQVDDLIYSNNKPLGWVIKKNDKSFRILKDDGTQTTWTAPKVLMMGLDTGGVMVLRSLLNMLPGGSGGLAGMQSMLMPMLMMGGDSLDLDSIMPMMLMSQVGAASPDGSVTPPMGNMASMMPMLMMMGMMKKK